MEANLSRKTSATRRQYQPPKVDQGKVHKRGSKRVSRGARVNANDETLADADALERVSPAQDRAADAVVKRATRGLMRLDSRRRAQSLLRKLLFVLIAASVIGGLGYYFADVVPTDLISEYWEELKSKTFPEPRP